MVSLLMVLLDVFVIKMEDVFVCVCMCDDTGLDAIRRMEEWTWDRLQEYLDGLEGWL